MIETLIILVILFTPIILGVSKYKVWLFGVAFNHDAKHGYHIYFYLGKVGFFVGIFPKINDRL